MNETVGRKIVVLGSLDFFQLAITHRGIDTVD